MAVVSWYSRPSVEVMAGIFSIRVAVEHHQAHIGIFELEFVVFHHPDLDGLDAVVSGHVLMLLGGYSLFLGEVVKGEVKVPSP